MVRKISALRSVKPAVRPSVFIFLGFSFQDKLKNSEVFVCFLAVSMSWT